VVPRRHGGFKSWHWKATFNAGDWVKLVAARTGNDATGPEEKAAGNRGKGLGG
jgi:hypothetical protein